MNALKTGSATALFLKAKGKNIKSAKANEGFSYICPFLDMEKKVRVPVKQNDFNLSGIQMQDFFICNRPREEK